MDKAKKEALQELLRLLADNPDLADRITITIKPNSKPQQGERQETYPQREGERNSYPPPQYKASSVKIQGGTQDEDQYHR